MEKLCRFNPCRQPLAEIVCVCVENPSRNSLASASGRIRNRRPVDLSGMVEESGGMFRSLLGETSSWRPTSAARWDR